MSMSPDFQFIMMVIGLDGSGKSTLIENFKAEADKEKVILPTAGVDVGVLNYNARKVVYYDFSGEGRHRNQWYDFLAEVHAILFVVDATDEKRTMIVRTYIKELFRNEILDKRAVPILIACNKQDVPNCRDVAALEEDLMIAHLERLPNIKYRVMPTSGFDNKGLLDGLNWLNSNIYIGHKRVKK